MKLIDELYHRPKDCKTNYLYAREWYLRYRRISDDAEVRYQLGMLYKEGDGHLQQDFEGALEWFRVSGHDDAQYQVGLTYFEAENYTEAKKVFDEYEKSVYDDVLYRLGWMYYKRLGVEQDIQVAKECFRKTIQANNDGESYAIMAQFYYHGIIFQSLLQDWPRITLSARLIGAVTHLLISSGSSLKGKIGVVIIEQDYTLQ